MYIVGEVWSRLKGCTHLFFSPIVGSEDDDTKKKGEDKSRQRDHKSATKRKAPKSTGK